MTGNSRQRNGRARSPTKKETNIARMATRLGKNSVPMDYHSALRVLRDVIKERPDAILVNEGANTLDQARGVIDMYQPRKRLDVGTWGVMGIGMGFAIAAAVETGKPVLAIEGDSAFGFSGMEVETICRYDLPVCVVVFNNDGIYRGDGVNTAGGTDPATTGFVGRAKSARYDRMIEALRRRRRQRATTPDELKRAVDEASAIRRRPTLINAVIDPAAGSESGNIGQSQSEKRAVEESEPHTSTMSKAPRWGPHSGLHLCPVRADLHAVAGVVRRRCDQGRTSRHRRHHARPVARHSRRGLFCTSMMLNHNKRSITIDGRNPDGKQVLEELVKSCDVMVENFALARLDRMGHTGTGSRRWNSRHDPGLDLGAVSDPDLYADCKVYENVAQCARRRPRPPPGFDDGSVPW